MKDRLVVVVGILCLAGGSLAFLFPAGRTSAASSARSASAAVAARPLAAAWSGLTPAQVREQDAKLPHALRAPWRHDPAAIHLIHASTYPPYHPTHH